jgi:hypothetical protein
VPAFKRGLAGANAQKIDLAHSVLDTPHCEKASSVKPFIDEGLGK